MAKTFTIINQKGGVGKTTTAEALARGLTEIRNKKVLCIDLDPQANLSLTLQAEEGKLTSLDVLQNPHKVQEATQAIAPNLFCIPSTAKLTNAGTTGGVQHVTKLKEALQLVSKDYDYIIIDTPPSLSILTINALVASQECVITTQADLFSMRGIVSLYASIRVVMSKANPDLKIAGVLLTRFNPRTSISKAFVEQMEKTVASMNTKLFKATIRECNAIREAQVKLESIFTYAPKSNASKDYKAFIDELLPVKAKPLPTKPMPGLLY